MSAVHERVHKATQIGGRPFHCGVCGARIKRITGGQGTTWVHEDSGAVAAPNPPTEGADKVIVEVFERELGITFGEDEDDAGGAWRHLRRMGETANRVHSDPNYVKGGGHAPRKNELARQVDALTTLALRLREAKSVAGQLTQLEWEGDDFAKGEAIARALGFEQHAYTSTSALWGLFCLPENPATAKPGQATQGGCIIKTRELGFLFVQDGEDRGLENGWADA